MTRPDSGPVPAAFSGEDHARMARALRLAARVANRCDPNPRVGCVIVRDGEEVGSGWHRRAGEPHAEVHALAAAGERARGATAYVSLEPCSHRGRTPPCTDALLAAGVARVVYAAGDPDPRVDGGGRRALEAGGVTVASGLLAGAAEALNRGFVSRLRRGRPWVASKLAASLDGRTALADGASRWITGPAARADVQRLRAASSAILTGVGTVLADDPRLDVRLADDGRWLPPVRVILDTALRTPPDARLLRTAGEVWIFAAEGADPGRAARLREAGARVETVPGRDGRVDAAAVLRRLGALEVNAVLVEAGATLNGALMRAGLVDSVTLYLAPHLLGSTARPLFDLPPLAGMDERQALQITEVRRVGDDLRICALPKTRQ